MSTVRLWVYFSLAHLMSPNSGVQITVAPGCQLGKDSLHFDMAKKISSYTLHYSCLELLGTQVYSLCDISFTME